MENRKILFFDIDGTLLSHRTLQIPESAKKSIRKAKEKGHLVFINTGRTISVVNKEIKELGFDGYICGCGSYIEVDGEVIYSNDIDKSKYAEIINKIEEYDLDVVLEGREAVYYNRDTSTDAILTDFIKNNYPAIIIGSASGNCILYKICLDVRPIPVADSIIFLSIPSIPVDVFFTIGRSE